MIRQKEQASPIYPIKRPQKWHERFSVKNHLYVLYCHFIYVYTCNIIVSPIKMHFYGFQMILPWYTTRIIGSTTISMTGLYMYIYICELNLISNSLRCIEITAYVSSHSLNVGIVALPETATYTALRVTLTRAIYICGKSHFANANSL